jgi:hypothetical protein
MQNQKRIHPDRNGCCDGIAWRSDVDCDYDDYGSDVFFVSGNKIG